MRVRRQNYTASSLVFLLLCFFQLGCQQHYTPKPRGFHRLDFPEKQYQLYKSANCPFEFTYPNYAHIEFDTTTQAQPCWFDLVFPSFKARLHVSYLPVQSGAHFDILVEDSRKYAYAHIGRATGIQEELRSDPHRQVYTLIYEISGNVASSTQFFATDSTTHYLRGALYFDEVTRADSIQPVVDFLREDINTLIGSLRWR